MAEPDHIVQPRALWNLDLGNELNLFSLSLQLWTVLQFLRTMIIMMKVLKKTSVSKQLQRVIYMFFLCLL